MAQSSTHRDGNALPGDTAIPDAARGYPSPRTIFDDPLPSQAEVRSYSHARLPSFLQPLWDQLLPDKQASFSSLELDGESLLIIGAWEFADFMKHCGLNLGPASKLHYRLRRILIGDSLGEKSKDSVLQPHVVSF